MSDSQSYFLKMTTSESKEFLSQSVNLCRKRASLECQVNELGEAINYTFYTDDEYVMHYRCDFYHPFKALRNGLLITFISFMFFEVGILLNNFSALENWHWFNNNPIGLIVLGILIILHILLTPILAVFFHVKKYKNNLNNDFNNYKTEREQAFQERPQLQVFYDEISNELMSIENYMDNPSNCCIPKEYWNYADVIEEYIIRGRALTISDAINVFEDELYKDEMLSLQQETNRQAHAAARASQLAAEYAADAADAARNAEINSSMNLWLNLSRK